jgi:hypothetical protein
MRRPTIPSLADKLNERLAGQLPASLVGATPANLVMRRLNRWMLGGVVVGAGASLVIGVERQAWAMGIGVSLVMLLGTFIVDRRARSDPSQPGGLFVVVALTADDLVVIDQPLWSPSWSRNELTVAQRIRIDEVTAVTAVRRLMRHDVTLTLTDGTEWRWDFPRWPIFRSALPARLQG